MTKRVGKSNHRPSQQVDYPLPEPMVRAWLDAIAAPVLALSSGAQILYCNQACQEYTGYTTAELQGKGFWELPPTVDQGTARDGLSQLAAVHPSPPLCLTWVIKSGEKLTFQWTFNPLQGCPAAEKIWIATRVLLPAIKAEHQTNAEPKAATALVESSTVLITPSDKAEAGLNRLMAGTATVTGQEFFPTLVEQVSLALGVSHTLVTELVDGQLQTLAFWSNSKLQPNYRYSYLNTPCELSLQQEVYVCPVAVQQSFPKDRDLALLAAESYLGVAMKNRLGEPIGNLCLLDTKPLADVERIETILRIFAARAAAELERQRDTQTLEKLNQSVEKALQESQTLLRLVLDTLPLAIFWKDRNCLYLGCNQQMVKDAGLASVTDIVGKTDFDLPWQQEAKLYRADDLEVMETGQPKINIEEPITKSGNAYRWLRTTKFPLRNPAGEIIGVLGAYEDITDCKQMEAQFRQSNEKLALANLELARATHLKDEFLANVSHELRTPLSSILGMTQALSREVYGPMTERQHRSLNIVERSGRHLLTLINDILDMAKIEAGKIDLQMTTVSVPKLCQDCLVFVQHQALQKHILLALRVAPGVTTFEGDELRLKQALINLLDNAVKFTPEGGQVDLEVGLESCKTSLSPTAEDVLSISVIDNGIGIAPEDQERLFESFVKLDSSLNRQYFGTGLGLALVKRIVELHGGIVELDSHLDQGSRFTLRLPGRMGPDSD